ncbi:MAG: bifunctional riboflavin kinase/FAD synthetase, partial [Planctomycetota bacterium]
MSRLPAEAERASGDEPPAATGDPELWRIDVPASARGGLLSVGNFDGVHHGHRAILRELKRRAQLLGVPAVAVTFDPHPVALLRPEFAPPLLTTHARRAELLRIVGADEVVRLPVDRHLLAHTAEEFFERVLLSAFGAAGVVEGPDFRFGKDRSGDVAALRSWGRPHGWVVATVEAVELDGAPVSSSRIRSLISEGNLAAANTLLGRPHRIEGVVVEGEARGRTLGFPTANLAALDVLPPTPGVYAGTAKIDGRFYSAAVHLGPRPTFDGASPTAEVHLLDFAGDLYGRTLAVHLWKRIRGVRAFEGSDDLKKQIAADLSEVRRITAAASDDESG